MTDKARLHLPWLMGGGILAFARWFVRGKYAMMQRFLPELEQASRDPTQLHRDYEATLRHARRVSTMRVAVTVLLALGVIATAVSTISTLAIAARALQVAAAWSASASLLLLAARLLFDRYLDLVETSVTFLGIQIASAAKIP